MGEQVRQVVGELGTGLDVCAARRGMRIGEFFDPVHDEAEMMRN